MKKAVLLIVCLTLTSCGSIADYFTKPYTSLFDDDDDSSSQSPTVTDQPVVEPTAKFALAMGGVAPGRDELVLDFPQDTAIQFSATNDIVGFMPRVGQNTQLIPQKEGTATLHYTVGGVAADAVYAVTIPPQTLIQVLIGEARGQMAKELNIENGAVTLRSRSATAEALASVVKNRVRQIDATGNPGLFEADPVQYALGGEPAKYDAVTEAASSGVYQFSPVDPKDVSHDEYTNAAARSFLDKSLIAAYDQAVLTAAQVFDGTVSDPTNGAFGFRTPTVDEGLCLDLAAKTPSPVLPSSCDDPDARFPALAPVQVLIHPNIPRLSDGRPAIIFYRARTLTDPAVTTTP